MPAGLRRRYAALSILLAVAGAPTSAAPQEPPPPLRAWAEVKPPKRTHYVEPVLPADAARQGFGDALFVECQVGPDGRVEEAVVLNSVPELDDAVVSAARQWRYEPTRRRGVGVPVRLHEIVELWAGDDFREIRWYVGAPATGSDPEQSMVWPRDSDGEPPLELETWDIGGRSPDTGLRELIGSVRNRSGQTLLGVSAVAFQRNSVGAVYSNVFEPLGDIPPGETRPFLLNVQLQAMLAFYQDPPPQGEAPQMIPTKRPLRSLLRVPPLRVAHDGPWVRAAVSRDYDRPPRLKKQSQPIYPRRAFDAKAEGTVVIEILIDEQGVIDEVRIIQSLPGTGLDAAALAVIFQWRFEPATRDGDPVATAARAPVTYRIY